MELIATACLFAGPQMPACIILMTNFSVSRVRSDRGPIKMLYGPFLSPGFSYHGLNSCGFSELDLGGEMLN